MGYFRLFKCWLELAIIVADGFALSVSLASLLADDYANANSNANAVYYFLFFGVVVALHAVRIFHIFYATLNPSSPTPSSSSKDRSSPKKELCSIQGVLINRY